MTREQEAVNATDIKYIKEALQRIEAQVKHTNGRVSSLEKWKYGLICAVSTLAATKWPIMATILETVGR